MAWQDDDNDKRNDNDPWTGNNKNNGDEPPDLEQAIRRLFKNLKKPNPNDDRGSVFNGGGSGANGGGNDDVGDGSFFALSGLVAAVLLILWIISGIFIVAPAQKAVVLRFGQYLKTVDPGPHWIPRFIDERYIINVQNIQDYEYNAEMLTQDENIVSVGLAVKYRINNPEDYLFKVVNPEHSLGEITTSVLRQVVGNKPFDQILQYGDDSKNQKESQEKQHDITALMNDEIHSAVSTLLDKYQTGIIVTDVDIQHIKPPQAIIEAFDDVLIASEDKARYIDEASAYKRKVTLEAEGIANGILEEAEAVAKSHIAKAQAKTAEFLAELPQYQNTPKITRERLYLDAMSNILSKNPKLFITAKDNNSLMYLPLDKLMEQSSASANTSNADDYDAILTPNYVPPPSTETRSNARQNTRTGRIFRGRGQ